MELTILMPCLNEAKTLGTCINKAKAFLLREGVKGEIVVADNGSTDGSQMLALNAGARVLDVPTRGYGAALAAGISAANGQFVIMGDSDDSYDFSNIKPFLDELRNGAELVMGNRFKGGIQDGAMPFLHRYLGNPVLSFIGRLFFRIPVGDFHCGLRGFNRTSIQRLNLVTAGMEFASEMIAKAALAGLRIEEVPTTLKPDGRDRPPHLRTWRDGWRHLLFMLLFCPRWLFLIPGLTLSLIGVVGLALISTGDLLIQLAGFGIHTMLYMASAIVIGLQFVQLAFLTKWIGVVSGVLTVPTWMRLVAPHAKIETGLIVGGLMSIFGLMWSARLLFDWRETGYGQLDPTQVMKSAIPAVTLMIIGLQTGATALFAGVLHFAFRTRNSNHGSAK